MSSLTAAGKLRKSRLEDPTQCSGFSSAARIRRTTRLSQLWDNHASERPQSLRLEAAERDVSVYWNAISPNRKHMLLTIRTTHRPATDLGFLLHKHPEHVHTREFPFGKATVFYSEASEESCTAAVLLDVDPVGIVRGRSGKGGAEDQYVNDRPYVASSLLSVVLSRWFNSALGGRCERKPELAASELPLEARLAAVPCRGGEAFLRALFEPLGYTVEATRHELDESMPALGPSRLFTVTLRATCRLSDLLTHLYVLIPVLDDQKHYWVGDDEIEKLLRHGEGWLDRQPSRVRSGLSALLLARRVAA